MPTRSHPASSDSDLVARCRTGDQAAWNELIDRFSLYVHAIARRAYRLSDADVEDVFQDVFIRTYEHLSRLRDDAAIRPWIGQLTRRLCIDRLRAGGREAPGDQPADAETSNVQHERLARIDEAIVVHEALATLPHDMRDLLERFFLHDQSYRTIADDLDLPMGTIASRIARGLARLRTELAEDDSWAPASQAPLAATA
jgi:RNA polymerase sigma factor (sigma-70 family)